MNLVISVYEYSEVRRVAYPRLWIRENCDKPNFTQAFPVGSLFV
jgi:hypothetical protein